LFNKVQSCRTSEEYHSIFWINFFMEIYISLSAKT
jgi:hypothetical protein